MANIQTIGSPRRIPSQPLFTISALQKEKWVNEVGKAALKELVISLTFAVPTAVMAGTAAGVATVIVAVALMVLFNAALRGKAAYHKHTSNQALHKKWEKIANFLCPLTFGIVAYFTGGILFHEAGHAFAMLAAAKNPLITVSVTPFSSGVTSSSFSQWTRFGERMGHEGANTFIGAAGAAISVVICCIALGLWWKYRKATQETHPKQHVQMREASRYLLGIAVVNLANHLLYALSSFEASKTDLGHDFVRLWVQGGIHPLLSAFLIVLPLLIVCAALYHQSRISQTGEGHPLASHRSHLCTRIKHWFIATAKPRDLSRLPEKAEKSAVSQQRCETIEQREKRERRAAQAIKRQRSLTS